MSVITIPSYPPAPASIEFTVVSASGMTRSPFTGQQQVFDWNASWMEASVSMPAMSYSDAQSWVLFLQNLKGPVNTFQFSASFCAAYPLELMTGSPAGPKYWRLKNSQNKWSVAQTRLYGLQFECLEVR